MPLNTHTTISIAGKEFRHFQTLTIQQSMNGHHSFELLISYDWLHHGGKGLFTGSRELLGQEISIHIIPVEAATAPGELRFNGLITAVHAGKESDGTQGFCLVKGESLTILLDNNPHIQVFEAQTLGTIVNGHMKNCGPLAGNALIAPVNTATHPYLVQYRESNFVFLQRLAARFGEWFFYDGQRIIFGAYTPANIKLLHPVSLVDFNLQWQVKSGNTTVNHYDYRQDSCVTTTTMTSTGNMNPDTAHALKTGNRLYHRSSCNKSGESFHGPANAQVAAWAQLQRKRHIAGLVQLKGHSKHPGIRIGDTVCTGESLLSREQHGEFTITQLTHHCSGNGMYYNSFTGIPADNNVCDVRTNTVPPCESQSAVVTENHDPEGLGRLRVRFRWQQQGSTPWIRFICPHGGGGKGFHFMPETGEEVWVGFEGGNPELPFVMGAAYNGKAHTPFGDAGNNLKVIKTRSGHTIMLDDSTGEEQIIISDRNGNAISMDTQARNITITAPEELLLKARNIRIQATENIEMHAGENISQGAGEDMNAYAGTHATLMATHIMQQARENFTRTSKTLKEVAECIDINSIKENMVLASSKTVDIKSVEKIKLF
ncbi:phage baseplate assembly protein V [Chitinophaga sp. MM2321]|uniref:type VI secretion system Vgr family protein n=1 Tax=Chitinophaga sp. MM2321 TaxID=3137178 RepID=UPI0032D582D3